MLKKARSVVHKILGIEIILLLSLLYITIIVPMSLFQRLADRATGKTKGGVGWTDFSEKYQTIEDLKGEG